MSHDAYQMQWSEAMNDLQEQVKVEQVPKEKNELGVENCEEWPPEEFFQHFACLYIKYIEIYKKLEECYDQMVHPQKRATIKPVLEAVMSRITLIKKDLTDYNQRRGSIYVHLDQLLFDLKYDPSVIEIPVPRYFKEDDQIPVDIKFKEQPEKKDKKKGKKKGKKKKGKKKKGDEEEEKKPLPPSKEEKNQLLNNLLNEYCGTDEPETEIVHDPFTLDMDIVDAIRIIQKNERGRQYRDRICKIMETWKDYKENAGGVGGINPHGEELSIEESCTRFQKIFKGIIDRKRIEQIRNEELVFLGMAPKPKDSTDKSQDPMIKAEETRAARKATQIEKMKDYENAKEELKEEIKDNQGPDIQEDMIQERREWITQEIKKKGGTIPTSLEDFYKRSEVEAPLTPEEEELKKIMEEEEAKGKKKGKKAAKKPKGKKGKKKKGDDDEKEDIKLVGPPEEVQIFGEFQDSFNNKWANKDETDNFEQDYDTELVKEEVMPDIQKEFKNTVDKLIMMELENIKINQAGYKEKKKKGKKKPKKKGKGKKKKAKDPEWRSWPKKIPGLKQLKNFNFVEDLLTELVQMGIAKKFPAENLANYKGDFNYLHSMMDDLTVGPQDPSMALIRQLVTETCIFPLGSKLVKERAQFVKSCLFYGPPGTGKTLVARAVVHETSSMVFDLSPLSISGKYTEKKGEDKMVASVFAAARYYQPAVVYIDECEKIFPMKKKKGKKGKKGKKKAEPGAPSRMKKAILAWKKKLPQKDRILIIGCSSEPHNAVKKDMRAMWDSAIYFPFPDFSTRRNLWKEFIERSKGIISQSFPLSTLAHISVGYSAGSILKTCQQVLTDYRVQQLRTRPLQLAEFIGPLSLTHYTLDDLYKDYRKFTDFITKDDKRRAAAEAALNGDKDDGKKKGKKGKKGKKKGKKK